jgi:hypothetical protein
MINSVLRDELPPGTSYQQPLAPVSFAAQDNLIVWDPGEVKASWKD